MVNFPVFFTSAVASVTRSSITPETAFFSKPVFDAKASAIPLFGIAFTALPFMAFMAFMAFIAFAITAESDGEGRGNLTEVNRLLV